MTKTKKIINPGRDGELEQIPLKTDVAERVERGDLRQGSMQLQELADEVRGHELPIDHQAKAYDRTQLKVKQEKDEKQIYAEIERETGEIQKAFEAEIDELIDKKKLTKEERNHKQRELLKHAKLLVRRLEKNNRLHIFLFKSTTGTWWKMGGNSIAIHSLMVATYLDRDVKINVDRDLFGQFRDGVICLQDEQRLAKDIAYSGAPLTLDTKIDFASFQDVIRAYRLRVALSDNELRRFRKIDAEVIKSIHNTIYTATPEVELNNYITAVLRESYNLERHLDSNARPIIGHTLMEAVFKIRRAYYDVATRSKRDVLRWRAIEKVDLHIGDAMSILVNYADLGIANRSTIARLSLELAKAREIARQKLNAYYHKHGIGEKLKEDEVEGGS